MKIAIDARELQGKPTGVGRFLGELLAAWKTMPEAQAHEFTLLTPQSTGGGTFWEQIDLPKLVRATHADVLFSPGYTGPVCSRVPMVVAIHDVSFAAHPEWFSWREGARRRIVTRLAARMAKRIITISEFSKHEIVAYLGIDADKISVAYPGIADLKGPRRPSDDRSDTARTLRVRGTVLFVGSIFNRRHVPELIDGFARFARTRPDVQLEIVGDNRTSPRIDVQSLVQATGVGDRIHLRSYIPDGDLRTLYAESAAFVFLSEYEGFGLTPLEALAAGLPILLLDTSVAREVCGDAAAYVERADPVLIEEALRPLLFDAGTRERILRAARDVLPRYSWTDCAGRVLKVLIEAGSGAPERSSTR
jgi:glycosyltransferase involved in cell wall biosynthesis